MANALKDQNCLFVIGGGEFANLIRKYDSLIGFSEDATHETAIDSMDILAKLLNDKLAFTEISYTIEEAISISNSNKIPIMICSDILKENCKPFGCKAFNSNKCKWYIYKRSILKWSRVNQ